MTDPYGVNGAATGWPRKALSFEMCSLAARRQWGRDRMAAEGYGCGGTNNEVLASMGPRPDGRGRARLLKGCSELTERQWGRDRMAAEGPRLPPRTTSTSKRQWGRDRMAAEGK